MNFGGIFTANGNLIICSVILSIELSAMIFEQVMISYSEM